jgi:hypothetical protein
MKKHVELDAQGQPFGSMKKVLCGDIKKYAKHLDSTTGWEDQPCFDQKRLLRCLYADEYRKLFTPYICHVFIFHVYKNIIAPKCDSIQTISLSRSSIPCSSTISSLHKFRFKILYFHCSLFFIYFKILTDKLSPHESYVL